MDRGELGRFLFTAEHFDRDHAALAVLLGLNGLRVSEACATDVDDLGFERGHRTLRILGKGNKPAMIPLVPRTATISRIIGRRPPREHRPLVVDRSASPTVGKPSGSPRACRTRPRTTTIYDRRRQNFDRNAAYVVVAFVASG